jgi:hypothetical protein
MIERGWPGEEILKNSVLLAVVALALCGGSAHARQMPNPPPSGIVVHLFGPDSITSHVLPEAAPAPQASATAAGQPAASAPASGAYPEPSMGDVLHQMFVTGDPDAKPGDALARGRRGNN